MSNIDLDKGGRIPQVVRTNLGPTIGWRHTDSPVDLEWTFDGGTGVVLAGQKPPLVMPDWLRPHDWIILSPTVGSVVIDLWRTPLATWLAGTPPTSANSMTGTDVPTLTAQVAAYSEALTGWTMQINQNDVLVPNIVSISGLVYFTFIVRCVRVLGNP